MSGPSLDASPAALYERLVEQHVDGDTVRWLIDGFRRYDRAGGALPLERCLRLPTAAQRRRAERDVWLRAIAACIDESKPIPLARAVTNQLAVFMERGSWREWRAMREPPVHATDLQRALFGAAHASGKTLRWKTVYRALLDVANKSDGNGNDAGRCSDA